MNQEKEMMQNSNSAGGYLAPRVKVVEVKARKVMCESNYPYGTTSGTEVNDYD